MLKFAILKEQNYPPYVFHKADFNHFIYEKRLTELNGLDWRRSSEPVLSISVRAGYHIWGSWRAGSDCAWRRGYPVRGRGHLPSGAGVLPSPHPPVVTDYPATAQVRCWGAWPWPPSLWYRGPTLASPTSGYRLPCHSSGKVVRLGGVATFPLVHGSYPRLTHLLLPGYPWFPGHTQKRINFGKQEHQLVFSFLIWVVTRAWIHTVW